MTSAATLPATADFERVLIAREGYRLPGSLALGIDGQLKGVHRDRIVKAADAKIDSGAMSITALISTPDEDRSEDIVEPLGCKLDRYSLNPINYFDHGVEFTLPIGKSKDDAGNLTVTMSEGGVTATSFFPRRFPSRGKSSRFGTRGFCGRRRSTSSRSFARFGLALARKNGRGCTLSSGNCSNGGRSEFPTILTRSAKRSIAGSLMGHQSTR